MIRLISVTTICLLVVFQSIGQITGTVYDENMGPLAFASIYIKNTSIGMSTNLDGHFDLKLKPGSYSLVFQYLGYKTENRQIRISKEHLELDVQMERESVLLSEVVVSADAEDPAYRVIRNAIKKRSYYRTNIEEFACDVYVKGNQKILDAPEKILGFEIGDLEGTLDSNRQGIVYLSESISTLYFVAPDQYKEVVSSSKISGDDQGYSFNSARAMEISFYEKTIPLNRNLVSPIAENALAYYRYKLLGTFYDEENRLINKIEVIPKRATDPSFYGTIYIIEDLWNIYGLQLGATAKATQLYFIDSLTINQVNIRVGDEDQWRMFNNTVSFKVSGLGFVFKGVFSAVYSNYLLDPKFSKDLFNRDIHVVQKESNERDSAFWMKIRPIPLTTEEVKDYIRKDSIQKVKENPEYQDSVDRKNNRFKVGYLVGGYTYRKTRKHLYWNFSSPIGAVGFNTVQGFNGSLDMGFRKYFDKKETKRILFNSSVNYGFTEKKLRVNGRLIYRHSRLDRNQFWIEGGSRLVQFNEEMPIGRVWNTYYSLLTRRNYAKYFDKRFLSFGMRKELFAGVILNTSLKWEERSPLTNKSDYSFFYSDERIYTSNNPQNPLLDEPAFSKHQALIFELSTAIRFNQMYFVYPDERFDAGSTGPLIRVKYRAGLPIGSTDVQFQKLAVSVEDDISVGVAGSFQYYVDAGGFLDRDRMEFMDYQHFLGVQTAITLTNDYERRFLLLPYYEKSGNNWYTQVHVRHRFDGFILDKIPALNQLGLGLVAGMKYLKSHPFPGYWEMHAGLDKIGYKILRFFRIDVVYSHSDGQNAWGWRLGLNLNGS